MDSCGYAGDFAIEALEDLELFAFRVNTRKSGSAKDLLADDVGPPHLQLRHRRPGIPTLNNFLGGLKSKV